MTLLEDRPGLSVIVTSYERMVSLHKNLTSLVNQEMDDIPVEIIVVNNSKNVQLHPTRWTKIGRFLRQNPQIKIINSQYNWHIYIRYGMVFFASYDTILFIDDDIYFKDNTIMRDMYNTLMGLGRYDIVSCWNMLWVEWTDTELFHVSATLLDPELKELTKTDTCGPGISMFNRWLILHEQAQRHTIAWTVPDATDYAFGLLPNMLWDGATYAMPMYNRAAFSEQFQKHALHINRPNFISDRMLLLKDMYKNGYTPVIKREPLADDSPEMKLAKRIKHRSNPW